MPYRLFDGFHFWPSRKSGIPIFAIAGIPFANKKMQISATASTDVHAALKKYKEEHFTFRFVYHSAKNPKEVLLDDTFKY